MLKKRIWIVLAVVLLIAVCAWYFADGPWNWMQRLVKEDIRSAAAWAHVPEWEQRELSGEELSKLLFLLRDLDRDDFTKNRQLAGGTPEYGLVIETEDATYRINQSIAPDGEMEISRLGEDGLWWIDEDELADFVKSVLPERTISVPEQPKEPVQPQEPEKPQEQTKPEEPVIPKPDDDAQKKNAALKRLSNLRPEEIVEIEYPSADPAELAALIRKVAANPVERTEDKSMFEIWGLWVDMTTNADGAGREELLRLYASPEEENVVKLYYRSGTRENTTLCLEDSELYWFVRNRYSTEDVIDKAAMAPYYEILAARAQETVDKSADWQSAQPLSGYEILSFEPVDFFIQDGTDYFVYKWDVAFLAENPAKVELPGGMWLDSQCRVRSLEAYTYFVVRSWERQTDCEFFSYDLYMYCQEGMTQQESAHWEITRVFGERMGGPVIPEEPDESALVAAALERLRSLQPEDIKEIDYRNANPAEVAALIRTAVEHRFQRTGGSLFAIWNLTVELSTSTEGSGRQESVWLGASPEEENVVQVDYRSGTGTYTSLYLEDSALYDFIRSRYSTKDVIDEAAMAPYYQILAARAQKTVDESANWHGAQPLSGYEILSFEYVDSFEKDGAEYIVYEWDVAFLTENPAKVGWAGGMWLDSQCRVRALELGTYFVVRDSGDPAHSSAMIDYRFFYWDLYLSAGQEDAKTYAHTMICAEFGSDSDMRVYMLSLRREQERRFAVDEETISFVWSDETGEGALIVDGKMMSVLSSAADYLQKIEPPYSFRILGGSIRVVFDSTRCLEFYAGEEPHSVLLRYLAPNITETAVVYDPQLYLYLVACADGRGTQLADLDQDGFFEAVFGDRSSDSLIIYDYYKKEIHRINTNQTIGCVVSTHSLPANIKPAYSDMIQAQSADGTVGVYSYKDGVFSYECPISKCLKSEP